MRRQARIVQIAGVKLGFCHLGVAGITANEALIRPAEGRVHDVAVRVQRQARNNLNSARFHVWRVQCADLNKAKAAGARWWEMEGCHGEGRQRTFRYSG